MNHSMDVGDDGSKESIKIARWEHGNDFRHKSETPGKEGKVAQKRRNRVRRRMLQRNAQQIVEIQEDMLLILHDRIIPDFVNVKIRG